MIKKIILYNPYTSVVVLICVLIASYLWSNVCVESIELNTIFKVCIITGFYLFIFLLQYLILVYYLKEIQKKALLLIINGIIPILFLGYLLYNQISELVLFEDQTQEVATNYSGSHPIKIATVSSSIYIYIFFLLHSLGTFLLNMIFLLVSSKKWIKEIDLQKIVKRKYVKPCLIISISTFIVTFLFLFATIIIDIVSEFG